MPWVTENSSSTFITGNPTVYVAPAAGMPLNVKVDSTSKGYSSDSPLHITNSLANPLPVNVAAMGGQTLGPGAMPIRTISDALLVNVAEVGSTVVTNGRLPVSVNAWASDKGSTFNPMVVGGDAALPFRQGMTTSIFASSSAQNALQCVPLLNHYDVGTGPTGYASVLNSTTMTGTANPTQVYAFHLPSDQPSEVKADDCELVDGPCDELHRKCVELKEIHKRGAAEQDKK